MIAVSRPYKHGEYVKIWLKSLQVMSKVSAMQDRLAASQLESRPPKLTDTLIK